MVLNSQLRAQAFYASHGYEPEGETFLDADDRAHPDDQGALMADRKPKPEIRLDQLTGLRTILSPARADRPFDFGGVPEEENSDAAEKCPFCEGHEDRTPPETWADRPGGGAPDSPGWRVRAVPNLYPALAQTEEGGELESERGR